ncbi:MAG: MATE family efflux transporter [Spirochaetia bacterium]|jgi:putative MATE family efflux protein|nr:MATE family efflux transporter [Spirochaetia bacterium]
MKSNRGKAVLTEGSVGKLLVKLTIPMIFGILGMVIYNLVDTFFVGRLGKDQLAALSFTFPVVLIIGSISHGLGIGTSALVSRAIGENDYNRVKRLATDSLVLSLIIVASFVVLGLLTIEPLFSLLGAGEKIIPYIKEYMSVWYIGMIFVVVPMVGNNIIRATGDSKTPGVIMMIGALLNGVLDPILIFGSSAIPLLSTFTAFLGFEIPPFGIRGAAAATLIGRSLTFMVAIYVLTVRERVISFKKPRVREVLESWKEILSIGIPNTATRMIIPIGAGVITRIISSQGALAVAGYGIATRIEFFALASVNALSSIIGPFVGQNLGAGRIERVREGIKKGNLMSIILGGFFFALLFIFAGKIASVFSSDPFIVSTASLYLRIVSAAYGLQGIYLVSVPVLNVFKKPLLASFLSIIEVFILIIPLALIGSIFFNIPGIFTAIGISYLITGLISAYTVKKACRNL